METQHVHIDKQSPAAYKVAIGLSTAVFAAAKDAGLPRSLVELVNVRVSLINGCPSCLEVHYAKAEAAGVTAKQLATLSVWRDTELFDEREQAALRLADHHHAARSRHRRA